MSETFSFSRFPAVSSHQIPFHSTLGSDLASARRAAKLTQAVLARRAGVSLPSLRQAERGRGSLSTLGELASQLGLEIGGPLPAGETLGARLAAARKRQKFGRRVVATLAGCSPATVAAVEDDTAGHLDSVARVAGAMGIRLRLVAAGSAVHFWEGAATSSRYHGWTTPPHILESLYSVVGGTFGLDPCSPVRRGSAAPVRARTRFTAEDNGLARPWRAQSVFVNPPYGRVLPKWVEKAHAESRLGHSGLVIALIPARTDTRWWHAHVAGIADTWMLKGRLAFGDGAASAPFASAIVVWGATADQRMLITEALPAAWHVPQAPSEGR